MQQRSFMFSYFTTFCRSICSVLATAASRCSFWLQLVIENSQRMKFAISMETQSDDSVLRRTETCVFPCLFTSYERLIILRNAVLFAALSVFQRCYARQSSFLDAYICFSGRQIILRTKELQKYLRYKLSGLQFSFLVLEFRDFRILHFRNYRSFAFWLSSFESSNLRVFRFQRFSLEL